MPYKIAVVEDDDLIRYMVNLHLEKNSYQVQAFSSAEAFLESRGWESPYDLLILDIMLPGMSGESLLSQLQSEGNSPPVLMLTAKSSIPTRLKAFSCGADDFLSKPFNLDELLARVIAIIRRSQGKRRLPASGILTINGHSIDTTTRICESNLGEIRLSEKEIKLIIYLIQHSGENLSRADILEEVWGMDVTPTPRTVDNFVLKLRKLFETDPDNPTHFISVRSRGYCFRD